jgi:hypothetical protein
MKNCYRTTFWLKRQHAAQQRRIKRNRCITHAMLMRWKQAQRRKPIWFFHALFGIERWWEVARYSFWKTDQSLQGIGKS